MKSTAAIPAVVAGLLVVFSISAPSYTDAEIVASVVDTWEVSAMATIALLVLCAVCLAWSAVAAVRSIGAVRRIAVIGAVASLAAGTAVLHEHIVLTGRVAQLTGQSFGHFYGLLR